MICEPYQVEWSTLPRIIAESEVWIHPTESKTHPVAIAVYVPERLALDLFRLFPPPPDRTDGVPSRYRIRAT